MNGAPLFSNPSTSIEHPGLLAADANDVTLLANAHPASWINPKPAQRYDLVVLGGGAAGLAAVMAAAQLGARVALLERDLLGGTSLNTGSVPSKALLRSAQAAAECRRAGDFGIRVEGVSVDFPAVMDRLRRLRADLSRHISAIQLRDIGVDVYLGAGGFTGKDRIEVAGQSLTFNRALIATGAAPVLAPIPGLAESGCLTTATVFALTELPRRLAVIGAGPVGCELGQAFARLGSGVTLLSQYAGILPREDEAVANLVQASMSADGVRVIDLCAVTSVEQRDVDKVLNLSQADHVEALAVDAILAATGRSPNVEGLGLETAGVAFDPVHGVRVSDYLQTSNPQIYAAGDCCSRFEFTHAAEAMAWIAVTNALARGRARVSALTIPWCTYTDPELARVGPELGELADMGQRIEVVELPFEEIDRAVIAGEKGLLKIYVGAGTDQILGAAAACRNAGELISELTLAMSAKIGLSELARAVHPYPTLAEAIRKAAEAYERERLTPDRKKWPGRWLRS
jgi:pyruvate/2-oxoglutarate dehydrogenase complex dihydrolipoamide dehydrogenase (E3) component